MSIDIGVGAGALGVSIGFIGGGASASGSLGLGVEIGALGEGVGFVPDT